MNQQTPISAEFQRLSVNITAESAEILRMVKAERGINTTEAVRRAIGLLGMFERAAVAPAGAEPDPPRDSGEGSTAGNAISSEPSVATCPERW